MTGERTRRFPLGLADLVREPRTPLAGGAKSAAAKSAAAKPVVVKPAAVKPAVAKPAAAKPIVATTQQAAPRAGTVRRADAAPIRAAQPATPIPTTSANRTATARGTFPQRPGAVPTSGAPGVPLNGALALTSERVRERMVERLRANGVADPRVLQALAGVPRHMFVDPGLATQAYEDAALPIGHQQTISKPSVVARMLELAGAGRTLDRVLEIGTGCGYQAAVLSRIARDVYSIERIKPLYERAKTNLRPLRIPNIRLHYGDGRLGLPSEAPFDAIVIAAAGFDVPQALLEQLAIGGRLVAPVASAGAAGGEATQVLTLVERTGPAQWRESRLDRVFFVPLKSGVI